MIFTCKPLHFCGLHFDGATLYKWTISADGHVQVLSGVSRSIRHAFKDATRALRRTQRGW